MPKNPVQIHSDLLDQVVKEARASERRRMNYNFHQLEDPANRMLNAIEPESYIRPHRHLEPPRDEAFFVLRGQGLWYSSRMMGVSNMFVGLIWELNILVQTFPLAGITPLSLFRVGVFFTK